MTKYKQLISVSQLSEILKQDDVIILDASIPPMVGMKIPPHSWPISMVETAQRFDINSDFSNPSSSLPHTMPSEKMFNDAAQQLGINGQSQIVVYDHFGIFSSARAWWMFKAMGHENIAVLNGGLPAWVSAGKKLVNAQTNSKKTKGNFQGILNSHYFCNAEHVLANIHNSTIKILDARSNGRFLGTEAEPRAGVRSGHIPNSVNVHYKSLQQNGYLLEKIQLKQIFEQAQIDAPQLITSCGSGVTACILALAADILGYKDTQVYDGSWSEWGADITLPIAP